MDRAVRVQTAAMSPWQTERRVIVFNAGFGSFRGCGRTESSAIVDDRTDLVVDRGNTPAPVPPLDVTDAPVCTHGCRDRFCRLAETRPLDGGRSGSPHPRVLRAPAVTGSPQRPSPLSKVEFGHTSTDDQVLLGLVDRTLPDPKAASNLRGCTPLEPAVQAAVRALQAAHGWEAGRELPVPVCGSAPPSASNLRLN